MRGKAGFHKTRPNPTKSALSFPGWLWFPQVSLPRTSLAMPRIEVLEPRIAPAAIVTVSFTGGALNLTGDTGDHQFKITALDEGAFQLQAVNNSVLFHVDGVATDTDTLLLTGPIKSLTATGGTGVDAIDLIGLTIAGNVKIDGGVGANTTTFDTVAIKGGLQVLGGAGADHLLAPQGSLSVKKDVVLSLGDGANGFESYASTFQVGGQITCTGGSGADAFGIYNGVFSVGGNLTLNLGAGSASLTTVAVGALLGSFKVGKKLTFDTAQSLAGELSTFAVAATQVQIGGDTQITDGLGDLSVSLTDSVTGGFLNLRGALSVVSGGGGLAFTFGAAQAAAKSISIDASAATIGSVSLGAGALSVPKGVTYTGGNVANAFSLLGRDVISGSSLQLNLGAGGTNTLSLSSSAAGFFQKTTVIGGSGDDSISIDLFKAKTASIDIQPGTGADQVSIALAQSTVSGKVSVTPAADSAAGKLTLKATNSTIGSLDYLSARNGNEVKVTSLSNGLTVKKAIHIVGGAGDDVIDFGTVLNFKIVQGFKLELGDGTNEVTGNFSNLTAKSFTLTGGVGQDTVDLGGSGSLGTVSLTLGAGKNAATFEGSTFPLTLSALAYISASGATDPDSLTLDHVGVTGKLDAKFGAGISTLLIDDSIIGGTLKADTGAGADVAKLDTGATNAGTVLAKAVSLILGDDADMLILGGNGTSSLLTTKSTFFADGGVGTNTLTNDAGNVFAKAPTFVSLPTM